VSDPIARIAGVYLGGAPGSKYRTHREGCTKEGWSCCSHACASIGLILDRIRTSPILADRIAEVRSLSGEAQNKAKIRLVAVTPAALFYGIRAEAERFRPTGIVSLDFDSVDDPAALRTAAGIVKPFDDARETCTVGAYISPSGTGVKVFAHVTPTPKTPAEYKLAYLAASETYRHLGEPDVGNDVTRLSFLSSDPDCLKAEVTWGIRWQ